MQGAAEQHINGGVARWQVPRPVHHRFIEDCELKGQGRAGDTGPRLPILEKESMSNWLVDKLIPSIMRSEV
ncbi:MAG: hypothetical protein ACN6OX_02170, partial [Pseudomonas sp.]